MTNLQTCKQTYEMKLLQVSYSINIHRSFVPSSTLRKLPVLFQTCNLQFTNQNNNICLQCSVMQSDGNSFYGDFVFKEL